MTTDADLQRAVAAEYLRLADALEPLPDDRWDTPSLCDRWRVREVVAHLTMPARYDTDAFLAELRASAGDFGHLSDRLAARDGAVAPASLVADLRDERLHQWTPPGGGQIGALDHVVIHGLDITVPLDLRTGPPEPALIAVLDDLVGGTAAHFGITLDGRRFTATDIDWRSGTGTPVTGTAAELVLLLTARQSGPRAT
jgi:uncharacterized protein (TIGR03083 family)